MTERLPALAVDFDGVIHGYSRGWADGTIYDPPLPGALDGLRALMATYAVFIHTSRDPFSVAAWLQGHGLEVRTDPTGSVRFWDERDVLLVTDRKLPAAAYLDDRAVRFTSWPQALRKLIPDQSYTAAHERIINAVIEAWPKLAEDPVFVDQLAHVTLRAADGGIRD